MARVCPKPRRTFFELTMIGISFIAAFLSIAQFTGYLSIAEDNAISPLGDPITSGMAVLLVILSVLLMSRTK